jgi:hypothetical protein
MLKEAKQLDESLLESYAGWFTPVIPVTWEAETGRSRSEATRQKCETLSER